MIQRIQSIYLLLVAAVMAATTLFPLVEFSTGGEVYQLLSYGLRAEGAMVEAGDAVANSMSVSRLSVCVGVLCAASALLPFITIFLFKKRRVQIRLAFAEFVLLVGAILFLVYAIWSTREVFVSSGAVTWRLTMVGVFPLIALILNWMALRRIIRDEALVRSLDRIR